MKVIPRFIPVPVLALKWRRSFAVNAWKIWLGRRLLLHHMGDSHANVGARNSGVDVSQSSVRWMAFVDVQTTARCSLSQSMVVQSRTGSHSSRPNDSVSR